MGTLDNKHLFLAVLEAGKSDIKVLADPLSSEGPLPNLAVFLLCLHSVKRERKKSKLSCVSSKGTNPICEDFTFMT